MCFSAAASLATGGMLGATGALTLSQVKKKEELPLASIPLLFGAQQAVEGAVWLSFGSSALNTVAVYTYSLFSHVLWPVFVPIAVLLIETNPFRKKILYAFSFLGFCISLYLLYFIIAEPITAHIVGGSIAYHSPHLYPFLILGMYLVATCGSCLVSSHRIIRIFGIVLAIAFAISTWFFTETFFSVWCFFAAILSILVFIHLRGRPRSTQWYVVTGSPSSGKTTTINLLKARGYKTAIEHARHYIDTQRTSGETTEEIKSNQRAFQSGVLAMQIKQEQALSPKDEVFLDRAVPDALAYYRFLNLEPDKKLLDALRKVSYKKIFILDPLPLAKDYARTEDEPAQKKIHALLTEVYASLPFPVVHVPVLPPEKRVDYILNRL